jgi:D-sedoheptulose 7-phosphate isomerase
MQDARIEELCQRIPSLQVVAPQLAAASELCRTALQGGGTLFVCGNGGSRADAEHITGELMKGFREPRPLASAEQGWLREHCGGDGEVLARGLQGGLRALVLGAESALSTAVGNDRDPELIFAQPLYVLGRPGDVLLALSTSGNARNVALACRVARLKSMQIVGFTGAAGGTLAALATVCLRVPATETYLVQELHMPLYHCLCALLEEAFFAPAPRAGSG